MAKNTQMSTKTENTELRNVVSEAISEAKKTGNSELSKQATQLRKRMKDYTRNAAVFHKKSRNDIESILRPENNERLQKLSTEADSILLDAQRLLVNARRSAS